MRTWLKAIHLLVTLPYRAARLAGESEPVNQLDRIKHMIICEIDYMGGECTTRHLAEQLPFSGSSITGNTRELQKQEYIRRYAEGKEKKLALTEKGKEYARLSREWFRSNELAACQQMSEKEKEDLKRMLCKIRHNLYRTEKCCYPECEEVPLSYYSIRVISRAVNRYAKLDDEHISLNQKKIIFLLRIEDYWVSYKELERRALIGQMEVFRCIKELEAMGCLESRMLPGDGKAKQARLTAKGIRLSQKIYEHSIYWLELSKEGLSKEEISELFRLLLLWRDTQTAVWDKA